jgi:hypothetical protein
MLPSPRVFVNFAARLDPASDERRRRLERAHRVSAPRLLAIVFADFEKRFLSGLDDTERTAYFDGDFRHIAARCLNARRRPY